METTVLITVSILVTSINCTLRNGNGEGDVGSGVRIRINCTLRNGNRRKGIGVFPARPVLIVPCGMETTSMQ